MTNYRIAISGSYTGHNIGKLFENLSKYEVLSMSLIGREITLNLKSENIEKITDSLRSMGMDNLNVLQWEKYGLTVSCSGFASDEEKTVKVSLMPSALGEGIKSLAVQSDIGLKKETTDNLEKLLVSVLEHAGITDALYILRINKKSDDKKYASAVRDATIKAVYKAGGVTKIEVH